MLTLYASFACSPTLYSVIKEEKRHSLSRTRRAVASGAHAASEVERGVGEAGLRRAIRDTRLSRKEAWQWSKTSRHFFAQSGEVI